MSLPINHKINTNKELIAVTKESIVLHRNLLKKSKHRNAKHGRVIISNIKSLELMVRKLQLELDDYEKTRRNTSVTK